MAFFLLLNPAVIFGLCRGGQPRESGAPAIVERRHQLGPRGFKLFHRRLVLDTPIGRHVGHGGFTPGSHVGLGGMVLGIIPVIHLVPLEIHEFLIFPRERRIEGIARDRAILKLVNIVENKRVCVAGAQHGDKRERRCVGNGVAKFHEENPPCWFDRSADRPQGPSCHPDTCIASCIHIPGRHRMFQPVGRGGIP